MTTCINIASFHVLNSMELVPHSLNVRVLLLIVVHDLAGVCQHQPEAAPSIGIHRYGAGGVLQLGPGLTVTDCDFNECMTLKTQIAHQNQ